MTEPTELLACPFCSGVAHIADDLITFYGECGTCGATSDYSSYKAGAVAKWNRRTPTPHPTQAQAGAVPLTCKWTHNADDSSWDTECGQSWRFDDGGPKENHMNFCHCCGKTLRIKGGQHGAE